VTQSRELTGKSWDVVVIGTGMGGATLGYALARAGRSVLFCEQGRSDPDAGHTHKGAYAETYFDRAEVPLPKHGSLLKASGRWWEQIDDVSSGRARSFIPFLGAGVGGSSALYGMALERFFPSDFTPRRHHPGASDSALPDAWPITFDALAPFYREAEELYRVRGGTDPLKQEVAESGRPPSPGFSGPSLEIATHLEAKGLHPYRIPLACEHVSGCRGCQGYLCPRNCKNDSWRVCGIPAIRDHGAALLDECAVQSLEADGSSVVRAVCMRRGQRIRLEAKTFVLAAGALATPAILLRSVSAKWPRGLANDADLVGRFLMRHFVDLYAVSTPQRAGSDAISKQLAFNDFYLRDSVKLGSVQSFGDMPPAEVIVASLVQDLRDGPHGWLARFAEIAQPILRKAMGRLFGRSTMLASILEDLPYADNRVTASASADDSDARMSISYRVRDYDKARIRLFRKLVTNVLQPYRYTLIKQAENNHRIAHVCGTCRFGDDPATSVLDSNNRAHAVSNLYVVDASFFPSSGGTNPALTIAANALRVADHLERE